MSNPRKIYKKENFNQRSFPSKFQTWQMPHDNVKMLVQEGALLNIVPSMQNSETIEYKYNNEGFRSDDFKKDHDGKLHILFAGESEAEGASNHLEDIWTKSLYNKINNNNICSGFFNVGSRALSVYGVINQILVYIKKYGKPDIIFIVYPDPYRYLEFIEDKQSWEPRVPYESLEGYGTSSDNFHITKIACKDWQADIYFTEQRRQDYESQAFIQLKQMELICEILGIKLIWSTWDKHTASSLKNSNMYKNFIEVTEDDEFKEFCNKMNYNEQKFFRARDSFHHGKAYHSFWAEKLYQEYIKDNIE